MIRVDGDRVLVETNTLTACFAGGVLIELRRRTDDRVLLAAPADGSPSLELVFAGQEAVPLTGELGDRVECLPLNEYSAEIRFSAWNGDGVLLVAEDPATGDLVVEPSGSSSRPGLRACRWSLGGIDAGLELVAPFFQGVRLPLEDPLLGNTHWQWPHQWEAGLAILQDRDGGLAVHCEDTRYRYKALQVGRSGHPRSLGLETEVPGPLHQNRSAGGLAWRLSVHRGDWQVPAGRYRTWLEQTWRPRSRPAWLPEIGFAVSWCPTDPAILEALAARIPSARVLLHIPGWRQDPYDENYPTYTASAEGRAFIAEARRQGFRAMPHFNSIDMDPTHPVYPHLRDFEYREVESRRVQGWTWVDGRVRPVPESNAARLLHRDRKTMIKVHPGLALWRSILCEQVRRAAEELSLDLAFLDVTLCTWNLDNCLVEGVNPTEGMQLLIARVADLGAGLAIGGEGRNETTARDQSFSQVHLFRSWHASAEGLERTGACALNEFLFGRWCRSFGYSGLGGRTPEEAARMEVHSTLGAIPTVTIGSAEEIRNPNPAIAAMLARAAG